MNEFPPSKAPRFEFAETLEEPENQLRRNPESGRPPSTPRQTAAASRTGQDSASAVNPPVVGMPATRRGERGLSVLYMLLVYGERGGPESYEWAGRCRTIHASYRLGAGIRSGGPVRS